MDMNSLHPVIVAAWPFLVVLGAILGAIAFAEWMQKGN